MLQHRRYRVLAAVERPFKIGVHGQVPVHVLYVDQGRCPDQDGGAVDQSVQPAELGYCVLYHLLYLAGTGYVDPGYRRVLVVTFHQFPGLFRPRLIPVGDDYLGAFLPEAVTGGPADARPATGYNHHFILHSSGQQHLPRSRSASSFCRVGDYSTGKIPPTPLYERGRFKRPLRPHTIGVIMQTSCVRTATPNL